jgi:hypothetical protein
VESSLEVLAGDESERRGCSPAVAAMAGGGRRAHTREERGQLFIAECAQRRPCFAVKRSGTLMHGTAVVSECVSGGEGIAPACAYSPRCARLLQPRRLLGVCTRPTHAEVMHKL